MKSITEKFLETSGQFLYTMHGERGKKTFVISKDPGLDKMNTRLPFFKKGVDDNYRWSRTIAQWVRRTPINVKQDDFASFDSEEVKELLNEHGEINIILPNKDKVVIDVKCLNIADIGYVNAAVVYYEAWQDGPYFEDGPEDHHFVTMTAFNFLPDDFHGMWLAAQNFKTHHGTIATTALTFEEIKERSKPII